MRDCNRCVYSTRDGSCRKWECVGTVTTDALKGQGVMEALEPYGVESIDEFRKKIVDNCIDALLISEPELPEICLRTLERLKGEDIC